MPAYGITAEEVEELRRTVKAEEADAVVFVADSSENCRDALTAVVVRAREAMKLVPEETRGANPDGTTRYLRPRPGAARMYPETDIPPTRITEDHVKRLRSHLPELPEQKLERLVKEYNLNQKLARQVLDSEYCELFEAIVKEAHVSPITVAAFMTETLKGLKRDGVQVENVSEDQMREAFRHLGSGDLTKEAIPDIITWLSTHSDKTVQEAISSIGLKMLSKEELERIIEAAIERNRSLIDERGASAFGPLVGIIMKEVRGKAEAALVTELLKKKMGHTKKE
jgi:glutamyl-tRNA(Gln) amidotransferase subunit E